MIYFIATECKTKVKIGYTKDYRTLTARLKALSSGSPVHLEAIFCIKGDRADEKVYQEKFKKYKDTGEWFWIKGELGIFIKSNSKKTPELERVNIAAYKYSGKKEMYQQKDIDVLLCKIEKLEIENKLMKIKTDTLLERLNQLEKSVLRK